MLFLISPAISNRSTDMLKKLADRYWAFKRRRAEQTLRQAYLCTAPEGSPPSADPLINAHYAELREKPSRQTLAQRAALKVRDETLARADDPPRAGIIV